MTRAASAKTYQDIKARGLLSSRRWEVYHLVYQYPNCTAAELAKGTQMAKNDLSTRLTELRRSGVVQEGPSRVCRITSQTVATWITVDQLPTTLKKWYCCTWAVLVSYGTWTEHHERVQSTHPSGAWTATRKKALAESDFNCATPLRVQEWDGTAWILIDSKSSVKLP